ncbi:hypothetical protein [Kurthia sibirica]|uniref:Uncharacterized protein n=1 Tax=Kurthia sibirica TaxID=202750 RepID=A0A2U3AJ82_9BACL|nr:hypothetical protein [Kurthia sibirica]PWI24600.1 hypothetical protein DEX24_12930 [Kurthia sibirica]GEK33556.1 hypothetical protein KSI01_10890 [Kurthia sibirica]
MTENMQNETPKKKVSLQEAVLKQLEAKKNKANGGGNINANGNSPKKMKSQQAKKTSNTRRKMGV